MATGWNYMWGESWHEYLQRSTITNDLTTAQQESSRAMIGAISDQTASILMGIESSTRVVSEGIYAGFSMLGGQMEMIGQEISGLNASFQWGFAQMIAQMGGMSASLQELIEIARTPVQTWAYNQFEIARENFRKGLYTNCLKRLDKAINGDQTSAGYEEDWRFHQMIGVVRLGFFGCETKLIDLAQAEQAFLLAAGYAKVDEPQEAARAFLSAGWSAFVRGELPVALRHTEQAIALDANLTEALFQAAKIQMASGAPRRALSVLRKAIDQVPTYVVKAAADGDFRRHEEDLNSFYKAVRQEVFTALAPMVEQVLNETVEWAKTIREVAECAPCDRWRELLGGSWGLLELLRYRKDGFDRDRHSVANARLRGLARMDSERRAKAAAEEDERKRLEAAEAARVAAAEMREAAIGKGVGYLVVGAIVGAIVGFVAAILIGIPVWIVAGLMSDSRTGEALANNVGIVVTVLGVAIGAYMGWSLGTFKTVLNTKRR
jgi:tetratricopeptide (TPR) repeat protein